MVRQARLGTCDLLVRS